MAAVGGIAKSLLRGSALLWSLLIIALIGNAIANNIDSYSSASQALNFTMFVATGAFIVGIVGLLAIFVSLFARPIISFPLDGLAVLFTFISAIVLSAKLRAVDCGNIDNANLPDSWIGFGTSDDEKRCREIQASTVFMWFLWTSSVGCLIFTIRDAGSGLGGFGTFNRSRSSASRPNMSQASV